MSEKMMSIRAVKVCSNRESLENKFKRFNMTIKQRIDLLVKAMGNPAISYSSGYPSIEDRYEVVISAYLSGGWKPNYSSINAWRN
jgi:hypothetical protein